MQIDVQTTRRIGERARRPRFQTRFERQLATTIHSSLRRFPPGDEIARFLPRVGFNRRLQRRTRTGRRHREKRLQRSRRGVRAFRGARRARAQTFYLFPDNFAPLVVVDRVRWHAPEGYRDFQRPERLRDAAATTVTP